MSLNFNYSSAIHHAKIKVCAKISSVSSLTKVYTCGATRAAVQANYSTMAINKVVFRGVSRKRERDSPPQRSGVSLVNHRALNECSLVYTSSVLTRARCDASLRRRKTLSFVYILYNATRKLARVIYYCIKRL